MQRFVPGVIVLAVVLTAVPAHGDVITANDSGWYDEKGVHLAEIDNYIVGDLGFLNSLEVRNFIVFDLTMIVDEILGASVQLYNPDNAVSFLRGYASPDPTEIYQLYDVTTPIATLSASNAGSAGIAIFNEIGSGTVLGQQTVSAADNGTIVSIALNPDGLMALNNARGGLFAVGGAITTLGTLGSEFVFGFTTAPSNPDVRQLEFSTVPEPATIALLGLGVVLGVHRRRLKH